MAREHYLHVVCLSILKGYFFTRDLHAIDTRLTHGVVLLILANNLNGLDDVKREISLVFRGSPILLYFLPPNFCLNFISFQNFIGIQTKNFLQTNNHNYSLLPKYQPKRGGDLGWGKLFRFKCGIKNYFQLAKTNLRTQFNCNKIW